MSLYDEYLQTLEDEDEEGLYSQYQKWQKGGTPSQKAGDVIKPQTQQSVTDLLNPQKKYFKTQPAKEIDLYSEYQRMKSGQLPEMPVQGKESLWSRIKKGVSFMGERFIEGLTGQVPAIAIGGAGVLLDEPAKEIGIPRQLVAIDFSINKVEQTLRDGYETALLKADGTPYIVNVDSPFAKTKGVGRVELTDARRAELEKELEKLQERKAKLEEADKAEVTLAEKAKEKGVELTKKSQEKQVGIIEKYGTPEKWTAMWLAGEVAGNAPSAVSSFLLGLTTAVITKSPEVALAVGFSSSFVQEAGSAYATAKQQGVNESQSQDIGSAVGVINAMIEQAPLGNMLARNPAVKKTFMQNLTNYLTNMAIDGLFEGSTETIQEVVSNVYEKTYNENKDIMEGLPETFVTSLIIGGMSGGIGEAVQGNIVRPTSGQEAIDNQVLDPEAVKEANNVISDALATPAEKRTEAQEKIVQDIGLKLTETKEEGGVSQMYTTEETETSFAEAEAKVGGEEQVALEKESDKIANEYGAEVLKRTRLIGDTASYGSEFSLQEDLRVDPELSRVIAARKGLLGNEGQKTVLNFVHDPAGTNYLVEFNIGTDLTLQNIRDILSSEGVEYRSLNKDTKDIVVYDQTGETLDSINNLLERYNGTGKYSIGKGEFIGSDESRAEARKIYKEILSSYSGKQGRDSYANLQLPETKKEVKAKEEGEDFLIEEAKKYKSADEFIKAQGEIVYHGSPNPNVDFKSGSIDFTKNKVTANEFANAVDRGGLLEGEKPTIYEGILDIKNPKVITTEAEYEMYFDRAYVDINALKNQGFDGVIYKPKDGGDTYYKVFDPSQVKTKSQLTDIWNKAQVKPQDIGVKKGEKAVYKQKQLEKGKRRTGEITPEERQKITKTAQKKAVKKITKTAQKKALSKAPVLQPVGEGKTMVSKLAKGVEAKAVADKLVKSFADLPEYQRYSVDNQSERAVKLANEDWDMAVRIALGEELPPFGLLPESVFIAVENKALENRDADLLRQLATGELVSEATAMGQRIRMLAERNPDSAVNMIREVYNVRKQVSEKKGYNKKKVMSDLKKEVSNKVNKISKYDWNDFISSIEC